MTRPEATRSGPAPLVGHRSAPGTARGLAGACHPGPTVVVTALSTALAAGAGGSAARTALVGLAVLAGQLSIGWSNDWIDAARDRAVARTDKPVAAGSVPVEVVRRAALLALVAVTALSVTLGMRAAAVHLIAVVGSGWAYNLWLKRTWASWVPYVVCFGLLPSVITPALPGQTWPPVWAGAAGALLGFGAHLANVLPDLAADAATGVSGFPHRIGRTRTAILAPVALSAATGCVAAGVPGTAAWVVLAVAVVIAGVAAVIALTRTHSRWPFRLTLVIAVLDVALLVAAGARLR